MGSNNTRSIALFGATGLVGAECLQLLERESTVERIDVFVRRPLTRQYTAKVAVHVVDFDQPGVWANRLTVDQVFCALGTTIKTAGSQEAFRRVDYEYPLEVARQSRAQGARHYLLVSALGANSRSSVFYNRVKGDVEGSIMQLGFPSLTIARPSLLLGDRTEVRPGERIGAALAFLVPGKYKPVHANAVARALVIAAREDAPGNRIIESAEIRRMAAR